jgi:hypothetical protein
MNVKKIKILEKLTAWCFFCSFGLYLSCLFFVQSDLGLILLFVAGFLSLIIILIKTFILFPYEIKLFAIKSA